jgi:hypothetical protein
VRRAVGLHRFHEMNMNSHSAKTYSL